MQSHVNWIPRPEWLTPGNAGRVAAGRSGCPLVFYVEPVESVVAAEAAEAPVIAMTEMRALCERGIVPDSLA